MGISAKVSARISTQIKKYQSILTHAKKRDVSEADTVVIVNDILSDVLGYDKYQNVTSESAIRGTFVDLAVEVDNKTRFFIEVIRREIRRLSGIRVDEEYLETLLADEIIKRELVEGEEAKAAQTSIRRMQRALDKERKKAAESNLVLPGESKAAETTDTASEAT
jgi:hypothetical protein